VIKYVSKLAVTLIITLGWFSSHALAGDYSPPPCNFNNIACKVKVISDVTVDFQGNHVKEYKKNFEELVRLRLRNDLSMIPHDYMNFDSMLEKYPGLESEEWKARGRVDCTVWTIGKSPIAIHTECELNTFEGWVNNSGGLSSSTLSIINPQSSYSDVKESLRSIVETISLQFYKQLDASKKLQKLLNDRNKKTKTQ